MQEASRISRWPQGAGELVSWSVTGSVDVEWNGKRIASLEPEFARHLAQMLNAACDGFDEMERKVRDEGVPEFVQSVESGRVYA